MSTRVHFNSLFMIVLLPLSLAIIATSSIVFDSGTRDISLSKRFSDLDLESETCISSSDSNLTWLHGGALIDPSDAPTLQSLLNDIIAKMGKPIKREDIPRLGQFNLPQKVYQMILSSRDGELLFQDESLQSKISLFLEKWIESIHKKVDILITLDEFKAISDNLDRLIFSINEKYPQVRMSDIALNSSRKELKMILNSKRYSKIFNTRCHLSSSKS
jgi:hypothetical protein